MQDQLQPNSLLFVGQDATTLYGTTLNLTPSAFYKFAITSPGISLTQTAMSFSGTSPGGGTLDTDGTSIYVSNGQVNRSRNLIHKKRRICHCLYSRCHESGCSFIAHLLCRSSCNRAP